MSAEKKENSNNNNTNAEIIDLSSLENKTEIKNSEYILAILEICINSHKYNLPHSNSTRVFWEEVMNNNNLFAILKLFKAETLRKYWRIMRDLNNSDKIISIVTQHSHRIDNPCYKLLPIINIICDFIKAKEKDFANYLEGMNKTKSKKPKEDEGIDNVFTFTKNKRKADLPIEKPGDQSKEIKMVISNNDILIDPPVTLTEPNAHLDNNEEISLEEIINTLYTLFSEMKKEEIYQVLYKTSGNLKDAYFYLSNPEKYKNLIFVGTDDYIIQNLRNKSYYEQLLLSKGAEKVRERELFLKIK